MSLEDPNFERTEYQPFLAYGRYKTANILFAVALDRRLKERSIRATSLHPGGIKTELGRHLTPELIEQAMARWRNSRGESTFRFKSIPQGAATSVWCGFVASSEAVGGHYCEDCHVAEINDTASPLGVRSYALDPAHAEALCSRARKWWARNSHSIEPYEISFTGRSRKSVGRLIFSHTRGWH